MQRPTRLLPKYSLGTGDRFTRQASAQLRAVRMAGEQGALVAPVWNKSFREHQIIGSHPRETAEAARAAVRELGWTHPYFMDADHIGLKNADFFLGSCDFFTLDVADQIGRPAEPAALDAFVDARRGDIGTLSLPGLPAPFTVTEPELRRIAEQYLSACREAGRIHRHLLSKTPGQDLVIEVSFDETDVPQTPLELYFILAALADEGVPAQTIAPRFSGAFYKGIDYVGDLARFETEFAQDVAVTRAAVERFGFPDDLKLSIHSGSDKFSLYPVMRRVIDASHAGLHLKTAGTTWLEEVIGLSRGGTDCLRLAQEIYSRSFRRWEELTAPYRTVVHIEKDRLPDPGTVSGWDSDRFARTLTHDPRDPEYNPHFRQLLHVGYKIAAEMGDEYLGALDRNREVIGEHVTANLYERHLVPLFLGKP